MKSFVLSLVVIYSTTAVVIAKSQPGCDWSGTLRTSGANSDDDFYLTCSSGYLTSLTKADGVVGGEKTLQVADVAAVSGEGSVTCDWTGPRRMSGANNCDDFNFECYDSVLYGMKTVETEYNCPSIDYSRFGSANDGVVCNFATALRVDGANDGDDFALSCQNGTMDYIYFDNRRRLKEEGFLNKIEHTNLKKHLRSNTKEHSFFITDKKEKTKKRTDDSVTCTTWATAGGSWELLHEHNEDFTFEFTYGTSSTDEDSTTSEWASSFTASVEEGCEFEKSTISETVSTSIAETVSSSLTVSYTETTTVPCSSPNGNNEGGSLFQWILESQHVDESSTSTTVFSDATVCVGYQDTPKCPLNACADELCQNCTDWESTDTPTGGFLIGSCDWSGGINIHGKNSEDDYTLDCPNNMKMDGMSAIDSDSQELTSTTTTSCSSCDWTGPRNFAGPNTCDDAIFECYDGFIYAVTFVGDDSSLEASGCRDLVQPADPLTGVLCNWVDGSDFTMQDVISSANIRMFCESGVIPTFKYLI